MIMSTTYKIQDSTVIPKTGKVNLGDEINVDGYSFVTLALDYTNGDETSLFIYPYAKFSNVDVEFPVPIWTPTAGVYSADESSYEMDTTGKYYITLDVRGLEIIQFKHDAGNTGTPDGTLAAWVHIKES